jgi:hypothetical protein
MIWIEDSYGKIAARCVVCVKDGIFSPGPIYTCNNQATDLLAEYLNEHANQESESWEGAKLLRISNGRYSDSFLCPYIDEYETLTDNGDYLVICESGNIGCREINGTTSEKEPDGFYCGHCEGFIEGDSDDYTIVNVSNGGEACVCRDCLSEYSRCEDDGEYYPSDSMIEVFSYNRIREVSHYYRQSWVENYAVYCESIDEYWHCNNVTYCESDEQYYPDQSDDIFESECDGKYYLKSELCESFRKQEKLSWTEDQVKDHYTLIGDTWIDNEYSDAYEESDGKPILRLNYELDDKGIPVRLPELQFA